MTEEQEQLYLAAIRERGLDDEHDETFIGYTTEPATAARLKEMKYFTQRRTEIYRTFLSDEERAEFDKTLAAGLQLVKDFYKNKKANMEKTYTYLEVTRWTDKAVVKRVDVTNLRERDIANTEEDLIREYTVNDFEVQRNDSETELPII
jgi:hypothetical protein